MTTFPLTRKTLIVGNWKMNGLRADLATIRTIDAVLEGHDEAEVVICPPYTLVAEASAATRYVAIGGQDCHAVADGPLTGAISPAMLADAGARYVILGHVERRRDHFETDLEVAAKTRAALTAGLIPIVCVGEATLDRPLGDLAALVARQLRASLPPQDSLFDFGPIVIAYVPAWAIGTDSLPSRTHLDAIHISLRNELNRIRAGNRDRILYGGAVGSRNVDRLASSRSFDGLLIGRSSLNEESFRSILNKFIKGRCSGDVMR